jgi:hypothetical protein
MEEDGSAEVIEQRAFDPDRVYGQEKQR